MPATELSLFIELQSGNLVRLRTLVTLRWFAVIGQATALYVATQYYGLQIQINHSSAVIVGSVLVNFLLIYVYPENKRLKENQAAFWLVFDMLQLALLLFLAGGLNNPFALLFLTPVAIAATVLHLRSTFIVSLTAVILILFLSRYHFPITSADGVILALPNLFQFGFLIALLTGVVFLAIKARHVTNEMHAMSEALAATQLALAREQKLTDMGGVVAAAAHELGTPLATVKLVSTELISELEDHPELVEDVELIRDQINRCGDILLSMGQAGKDDLHLRHAPFEAVVREAAEPHLDRGKSIAFHLSDEGSQPIIARRPEIIHGLRNLIQNAVDFSQTTVDVYLSWSEDQIDLLICDDGTGFPQSVLGRIGDPYVRRRRHADDAENRPGYRGMGLGLFIAKTLLERSGARLTFSNDHQHGQTNWRGQTTGGAIVEISWERQALQNDEHPYNAPLGENKPNKIIS